MCYIFKNIKKFLYHEKIILFIMIICIFCSAFIINFSYGLYQNYNVQKTETEYELNEISPEIVLGASLTKKDFQRYVESLNQNTLNDMEVIYAMTELEEFPVEKYGSFYMRFTIHNGKYQVCETTKKAYEEQGMITQGRYINNEEEEKGSNVAMVGGLGNEWNEGSKKIKVNEDSISLFGNTYKVIGTYKSGAGTPVVPFLTIPDELGISGFGFSFCNNITRSQYEELIQTAEQVLPNTLSFPVLKFPDNETIYLYQNIMFISVLIAVLSSINFAMLYLYIIKKRIRDLSIFRICGCSKSEVVRISLGECAVISIPIYLLGTFFYAFIMKCILSDVFPYMEASYSLKIYIVIFLIYIFSMFIILEIIIRTKISKEITEMLKGERI